MRYFIILFIIIVSINIYSLDFSAYYETINRFDYSEDTKILKMENSFNMLLKQSFSNTNKFQLQFEFVSNGPYTFNDLNELSDYNNFLNLKTKIEKYYVYLMNFPFKNHDFTIGKQFIVLGKGDLISPLDYINPPDLTDPTDFTSKLGIFAIKSDYYFYNMCISNIFIPYFKPAALPEINNNTFLLNTLDFSPLKINDVNAPIDYIDNNLRDNFEYSFLLQLPIYNFNVDFIYSYRHDNLPWPKEIKLIPQIIPLLTNIDIELYYPRMHNVGISIEGNIFDIGIWADFVFFYPIDSLLHIDPTLFGEQAFDTTVFDGKYYYKYLIGADYIFDNNAYLNIQYLYGFLNEIGNENTNHYIFLSFQYPLLDEKLTLSIMDVAFEIEGLSKDSISLMYLPNISYKWNATVFEFSLIKTFLSENTLLGSNKNNDGFELGLKYYF